MVTEPRRAGECEDKAYCFVLLVKVVHVAIEDLNEKLDRHGGIHTGVGYSEGALQAFENSFPVAVEL
jgi:hypothetical protein